MAEHEKSTAKAKPRPAPHPSTDHRPQGEIEARDGGEPSDPGESGTGRGNHIPPGRNDTSFSGGASRVEDKERD